MTRDEALEELKIRLSDEKILRHTIAVEAVMREFAGYYNADREIWGMVGLLHNIDYEKTVNNPSLHGIVGADILENFDIDGAIVYSIRAHNDYNEIPRKRKMDKVLVLACFICEVIIKCALMLPNKKTSEVTVEFVIEKLDDNEFKEVVNRDKMKYLEELGFTVEKFIEISLKAIQGVSQEFAI